MSKIKVGIVGTGFGSIVHYPGFLHHPDFEPVIMIGRNEAKTKAIAKRLNIAWSTNMKDVLENEEIKAVSIVTPPKTHKMLILDSIRSEKHVMIEKPISVSLKESQEVLEQVEESGLTAMVNFEFRFIENRAYLIELLKSGYIGKIHDFSIAVRTASRLNPRKKGYNWWSERAEGGGVLNSIGAHYLDIILQIFGEIDSVYGVPLTIFEKRLNKSTGKMRKVSADDAVSAMIHISENVSGTLQASSVSPFGRGTKMEFYGEEGALVLKADGRLMAGKTQRDSDLQEITIPDHLKVQKFKNEHNLVGPFLKVLDLFSKGINTGSSPSPNLEDAIRVQRTIQSIYTSNSNLKRVKI